MSADRKRVAANFAGEFREKHGINT